MVGGLLMIALGLMFLSAQLGIAPGLDMSRLWPVILIVFGLSRVVFPDVEDGRARNRFGGFWLVFVGGIFLLNNFGVMTLGQSWPLFIVAGGVAILFGRREDAPHQAPPEGKL
jgi:hypothetical protein